MMNLANTAIKLPKLIARADCIIAIWGQSNGERMANVAATTSPNVGLFGEDALDTSLQANSSVTTVTIHNNAVDGSYLEGASYWINAATGAAGTMLGNAITALDGAKPDILLWNQGEAEAGGGFTTAGYKTDFMIMWDLIKSADGVDNPNMRCIIPTIGRTTNAALKADWETIQQAHYELAEENDDIFVSGVQLNKELADTVHYTGDAYYEIGTQLGLSIAKMYQGNSVGYFGGPTIESASISGDDVIVTLAKGGAGASDTYTGTEGWKVTNDDVDATINSTVISGDDITFALSATPSGVTKVYFGADGMDGLTLANITVDGNDYPVTPNNIVAV